MEKAVKDFFIIKNMACGSGGQFTGTKRIFEKEEDLQQALPINLEEVQNSELTSS